MSDFDRAGGFSLFLIFSDHGFSEWGNCATYQCVWFIDQTKVSQTDALTVRYISILKLSLNELWTWVLVAV